MRGGGKENMQMNLEAQRAFAERQKQLREYITDVERLPLSVVMSDPAVVYSLDDFLDAAEEEETIQKISRVTKKLARMRRKNVDFGPMLVSLKKTCCNKQKASRSASPGDVMGLWSEVKDESMFPVKKAEAYKADTSSKKSLLKGSSPMKAEREKGSADGGCWERERSVLEKFNEDMEFLKRIRSIPIGPPNVARTFPVSSSHTQFIKKLERADSQPSPPVQRLSGEITKSTSITNGTFKQVGNNKPPRETGHGKSEGEHKE